MKISTADRAQVLTQALPYIKQFAGKTVVIKYGGNAMISEELKAAVMQDVVLLSTVGIRVVLVHGGGPEISAMLKKIGKESRFVGGLRYTDRETMEVVEMVLAGKVNKTLVQQLEAHGGRAIGLCGLDGGMIKAVRHQGEDLGFVGDVTHVNVTLIRTLSLIHILELDVAVVGAADAADIDPFPLRQQADEPFPGVGGGVGLPHLPEGDAGFHPGVDGGKDPPVNRQEMRDEGHAHRLSGGFGEGLFDFGGMAMARHLIGREGLVAVGEMGGLGEAAPGAGGAGFGIDHDPGGLDEPTPQGRGQSESDAGRILSLIHI